MGKMNGEYRKVLRLANLIETLPSPGDKAFQNCDSGEKARMALEVAWKELTGTTYSHQWYEENKKYL